METALVRLSMPGGVGGQRCEPLPTRLVVDKQGIEIYKLHRSLITL